MPSLTAEQTNRLKKRAAAASIGLAATLIIIKTAGVFYTASLSVLSSMVDSLADLFASSITFFAVRYSSRPADAEHRYGHGKAEALSALIQTAFIAGSGIFILYDGIHRLIVPRPLTETGIGLMVMIISLLLTICLIWYQKRVARLTRSQAIHADAAHYAVDVISNLSIIFTLLIVKFFGIVWFDTLTACIISAYLLINAYKLAKEALALLLDKELNDDVRDNIRKIVLSCDHILGMHDLRTRDLGGSYMIELHLEMDGNLTLTQAHQYGDNVEEKLRQTYPAAQIIIHQDPAGLRENRLDHQIDGSCPLEKSY